ARSGCCRSPLRSRAMPDVVLKPGRERSVLRRHPWVLSGAVARVEGAPEPGAWVRVLSASGETLGYGHYAPTSGLRVRLLAHGKDEPGPGLVAQRIHAAVERRAGDPLLGDTEAVRLVNAEGDGLPGLIADRFADLVVVKFTSAGMARQRDEIAQALREASGAGAGFERADSASRREAFAAHTGPLWGEPPAPELWIRERSRAYRVDVEHGQKTGFYLDQRDARDLVQALARGRRVLDLFAYTGGFSVAAAVGGAQSLTLVESSAEALALARVNLEANAPQCEAELVRADAFQWLRGVDRAFDLVIADPPPLARARRDVDRAARAYKDLLLFALRRAAPGALVLAFACSHHVGPELFRKIAFGASLDAQRSAQILRSLGAPTDHPVSIDHPEGSYLTGLLLRA
ncbi:MAG TPA: class I SAM-dependent rRNA methyltransferase, partial [Myxococcota bacterium]